MPKEKKKQEIINRVTVTIDWYNYFRLCDIAGVKNISLERALNFLLNRGIEDYLSDENSEVVFL